MAHAQEIARANGSELHIAYAVVVPTLLRDMDLIDVDAHVLERRRKLKPVIEALCKAYGLDKTQVHLKTGPAAKVIPSIANKLKADLVVMGTVGRRGIKGKLIGNTAEQVLQHLRTDILAVK
jgi:universal stress protein E